MGIDIRFPIGLMFGVIGLLLAAFGMFSDKAIYQRSLGMNINLQWGLAMVCFAAIMLGLAIRAHGKPGESTSDSAGRNRSGQ